VKQLSIYERIGLHPIINAAGTLTRLGGKMMLPEVRDAMSDAANALVPIDELQAAASKAIAAACGSEAGYVTSGAAAGLTLATAACMVGLDVVKMDQLPFARTQRMRLSSVGRTGIPTITRTVPPVQG
jgi:L-seryl-tRNA(Ser) seleniumtransferase